MKKTSLATRCTTCTQSCQVMIQHIPKCRAINIPYALVSALRSQKLQTGTEAFLIHISTDQVYDGTRANSDEGCLASPVNVYGQTKKDAELMLQAEWPNHVSLRSSIIIGPQTPVAVKRPLLLQWMVRISNAIKVSKTVGLHISAVVLATSQYTSHTVKLLSKLN